MCRNPLTTHYSPLHHSPSSHSGEELVGAEDVGGQRLIGHAVLEVGESAGQAGGVGGAVEILLIGRLHQVLNASFAYLCSPQRESPSTFSPKGSFLRA